MSLTHIYHTPVIPLHLHDVPIAQMLMMHYMSSTFCRSDIAPQVLPRGNYALSYAAIIQFDYMLMISY